jgi:hypothetical protein
MCGYYFYLAFSYSVKSLFLQKITKEKIISPMILKNRFKLLENLLRKLQKTCGTDNTARIDTTVKSRIQKKRKETI